MPFITHVVRLNAGLVPSLLNSYYHCFISYHTDNIPDNPLVWKGWESLLSSVVWKEDVLITGFNYHAYLVFPPLHFLTWSPIILKLFIISHCSPEYREKEEYLEETPRTHQSLLSMRFYWCVGLCSIFTPQVYISFETTKTKQKVKIPNKMNCCPYKKHETKRTKWSPFAPTDSGPS